MTQPPPERETISRRQHYYDLTIVYCMLLIVLAQMPSWPTDPLRRTGIDVTGVVLFLLAGLSFLQVRRARKREKGGTP
jgi:hypothetical protein